MTNASNWEKVIENEILWNFRIFKEDNLTTIDHIDNDLMEDMINHISMDETLNMALNDSVERCFEKYDICDFTKEGEDE